MSLLDYADFCNADSNKIWENFSFLNFIGLSLYVVELNRLKLFFCFQNDYLINETNW